MIKFSFSKRYEVKIIVNHNVPFAPTSQLRQYFSYIIKNTKITWNVVWNSLYKLYTDKNLVAILICNNSPAINKIFFSEIISLTNRSPSIKRKRLRDLAISIPNKNKWARETHVATLNFCTCLHFPWAH